MYLQILWWWEQFSLVHWNDLQDGSPMNFLHEPRCGHINEVVDLGVLVQALLGEMVSNGPGFCLAKPWQPGQWRILSDMHQGGHYDAIGPDPMVFPKSGVTLEQLYTLVVGLW